MNRKEIERELKEQLGNRNLTLPQGIEFAGNKSGVTLTLSQKAIGLGEKSLNMQENAAAFEGWAVALSAHFLESNGTVTLSAVIPEQYKSSFDGKHCHYNRFLFRVMKFSEQFGTWFHVCQDIAEAVAAFKVFLASDTFVNSIGEGVARSSGALENAVEGALADKNPRMLYELAAAKGMTLQGRIFRQLPTGLFKGKKSKQTAILTGGKSAIDLWSEQDNDIFIFELKADNVMLGIVTELFFYANYMYDMFCDRETTFAPLLAKNAKEQRGYEALLSLDGQKNHDRVRAFFLSDKLHPLITQEVIDLLNIGAKDISYQSLKYQIDIAVH